MNALIRLTAWLIAVTLLALPVVAVLNGWIAGAHWPMRHLVVTGQFQQVSDAQVRTTVMPFVGRGFFAVDLESMRVRLAKLPWVQRVEVRKRWPDRLEVSLSEYRPAARWGVDRMLSEKGDVFPAPEGVISTLPMFIASTDHAADVLSLYRASKPLFLGAGQQVTSVSLTARGSWHLVLSGGTEIEVGRTDPQVRLQRFAKLLPRLLTDESRTLLRADLRYTNGFALSWGPKSAASLPADASQATT